MNNREADEYEALALSLAADEKKELAPGFQLMVDGLPAVAAEMCGKLQALAGGRVSFAVVAVRYEDACAGVSRAAVFSNECVHNRLILLDGALELTRLENTRIPGPKS